MMGNCYLSKRKIGTVQKQIKDERTNKRTNNNKISLKTTEKKVHINKPITNVS